MRTLRNLCYFVVGVLVAAVFMGSALAIGRVPAIVIFPSGTYAAQCDAHQAEAIAAHNCPGDAVGYSIVDGAEFPHKICRMTCEGQPWGDAAAVASVGCQDPAVTPYQEGGSWWCALDLEASCAAQASIALPVGPSTGGGSGFVSGTGAMNLCSDGCAVRPADSGRNGANWWASGPWYFTGGACAAGVQPDTEPETSDPNSPQAECAALGQGWGTVNGTVVCNGVSESTDTVTERTTTGPAGGTTTETETTHCEGGRCTVTTTRTHTGGGAAGGQPDGTETTVRTGDDRVQGSGSGTGEGDGESQKKACDDPTSIECLGQPGDQEAVGEATGEDGGSLTPAFQAQGACPSPVALGHGWVVPFDAACDLAGLIRPLVIAFAWLAAGIYVVGGLRNG